MSSPPTSTVAVSPPSSRVKLTLNRLMCLVSDLARLGDFRVAELRCDLSFVTMQPKSLGNLFSSGMLFCSRVIFFIFTVFRSPLTTSPCRFPLFRKPRAFLPFFPFLAYSPNGPPIFTVFFPPHGGRVVEERSPPLYRIPPHQVSAASCPSATELRPNRRHSRDFKYYILQPLVVPEPLAGSRKR